MSPRQRSTSYAAGAAVVEMHWIVRLARHLLGHTRYHDQANEVNLRVLRAEHLARHANDAVRRERLIADYEAAEQQRLERSGR